MTAALLLESLHTPDLEGKMEEGRDALDRLFSKNHCMEYGKVRKALDADATTTPLKVVN